MPYNIKHKMVCTKQNILLITRGRKVASYILLVYLRAKSLPSRARAHLEHNARDRLDPSKMAVVEWPRMREKRTKGPVGHDTPVKRV